MPSLHHEGLLKIIRDQPELVAQFLKDLHGVAIPPFTAVRVLDPTQSRYHPDTTVLLSNDTPVFGVVVEAQLRPDDRKRFTWPYYGVDERARNECDFVVLVIAADAKTAQWARRPIGLGGDSLFRVYVIGPDEIPIITDHERATREPYLAMLSVLAHGKDDQDIAIEIAVAANNAIRQFPDDKRERYCNLIYDSLGTTARKTFEMLDTVKPYVYEMERRGEAKGKAEAILAIVTQRAVPMTVHDRERILGCRDLELLDRWLARALTTRTIDDLFA